MGAQFRAASGGFCGKQLVQGQQRQCQRTLHGCNPGRAPTPPIASSAAVSLKTSPGRQQTAPEQRSAQLTLFSGVITAK